MELDLSDEKDDTPTLGEFPGYTLEEHAERLAELAKQYAEICELVEDEYDTDGL